MSTRIASPLVFILTLLLSVIGAVRVDVASAAGCAPQIPTWGAGAWASSVWTAGPIQPQQAYYDPAGRLVAVVDAVNGSAQYTYDATGNILSIVKNPALAITALAFTPSSGPAGTVVTICGTGFGSLANTTVSFNGVAATPSAVSASQITVPVPSSATTGTISVTSPAGTATTPLSFTVASSTAPTISGFSPNPIAPGATLTVTGANFDPINGKVYVNGQLATVLSASSGSLTATAPLASSGHVAVYAPTGSAVSTTDLIIPPIGYTTSNIATSVRTTVGQSGIATLAASSQVGLILFDATQGQQVSFVVTSSTLEGGPLCLYQPNGSQLGSCSNDTVNSLLGPYTMPSTGTFSLGVYTNVGAGSATVTLYSAPTITGTITEGGTFSSSVTVPGQNVSVTFNGAAGDQVGLATQQSGLSFNIELVNPDGVTPTYSNFATTGDVSGPLVLPVTGSYTILYAPAGPQTGPMTLSLNQTIQTTITQSGPAVPFNVTQPGQNALATFSGTSGTRVSLASQFTGFNNIQQCNTLTITDPDGVTLLYNKLVTCGSGNDFSQALSLTQTGTYTIHFQPGGFATGTATLNLYSVPPNASGTVTIGGSGLPLTVTVPGQGMQVSFAGTASQTAKVSINTDGNFDLQLYTVTVLNPDGTTLYGSNPIAGPTFSTPVLNLSQTGNYTVLIYSTGTAIGTATTTVTSN